MPKKIGFSLSACISDILDGKVRVEDVHHICTGCSPRNNDDINDILIQYAKGSWRKNPTGAHHIFWFLMRERKIAWLADWQKTPVNIAWGHWLDIPEHLHP